MKKIVLVFTYLCEKTLSVGLGKFIVSYLLYALLLAGISIAIKHFFPQAIAGQYWHFKVGRCWTGE